MITWIHSKASIKVAQQCSYSWNRTLTQEKERERERARESEWENSLSPMTLSLCINSCLMQLCTRGLQGLSVHMVQVFYSSNHLGQATVTTHTFPLSLPAVTTQIPLQLPERTSLLSFNSTGLETKNILLSHDYSVTFHLHSFFFACLSRKAPLLLCKWYYSHTKKKKKESAKTLNVLLQ